MELGPFKFLEKSIEDVPGLAYVVAAGVSIAGSGISESAFTAYIEHHHATLQTLRVDSLIDKLGHHEAYIAFVALVGLVACRLLYSLGSIFDAIIFDPLYSPPGGQEQSQPRQKQPRQKWWSKLTTGLKRKWSVLAKKIFILGWLERLTDCFPGTNKLKESRKNAKAKLSRQDQVNIKLYKSAAKLLHRSEEWQDRVKRKLEISKFARTLILPLLIVLGRGALYNRWDWPIVRTIVALPFLNHQISKIVVFAVLILLVTVTYLWFRILHLVALYGLIEEKAFWFAASTPDQREKQMLCIGSVVVPEAELEFEQDK